jgi:hypothetical protein
MNRPEPPQPMNSALEQLNDAVRSIFRKRRAKKAAKTGRPDDRPDHPSPPAAG